MKIKIMKRETDFIVEYAREKNMHELRLKVLEFLVQNSEGPVFLYIDTNSKTEYMPIEVIEQVLNESGLKYRVEPVGKAQRGAFGFTNFLKSKKKNKNLPENIILAEIHKTVELKNLYDKFLHFYDYALGIKPAKEMDELILRLKTDAMGLLFSKDIFSNTLYDSIVIKRMRMDAPYAKLENFVSNLKK